MLQRNTEREYKCLVSSDEYWRLVDYYQNDYRLRTQVNQYYCDQQRRLTAYQAVLRLRNYPDSSVLTFKIKEGEDLIEYEKPEAFLTDPEFLDLLAKYQIFPPFEEIGSLTTFRRLIDLPQAELCLDENHYSGIIDYEIEYELTTPVEDLASFVALLKKVDIVYQPNSLSKYQRLLATLNSQ